MRNRALCAVLATGLTVLFAAPMAVAAPTATYSPDPYGQPGGGTLTVTGDASDETFTLSNAAGGVEVAGPAGINDPDGAGTQCTASGGAVWCDLYDMFYSHVSVNGGAGNDTLIENRPAYEEDDTLNGDAGNDTLLVAAGIHGRFIHLSLNGGDGNDTLTANSPESAGSYLYGGAGNDILNAGTGSLAGEAGGEGDDTFNGSGQYSDYFYAEPGSDTYHGGTRVPDPLEPVSNLATYQLDFAPDVIFYGARSQAQTVSLDARANDGLASERDNVGADVETVHGGSGNDILTAGKAAVSLFGAAGNDMLSGGRSDDRLDGGDDNDRLVARAGNDHLDGGAGDDELRAGIGDDTLLGQDGADDLDGANGSDTLAGGAGAPDTCAGGPGRDSLTPTHGCERIIAIP